MMCEKRNWAIVLPNPSDDFKKKLVEIAEINGRSVGSEVQKILEQFVEQYSSSMLS